MNSKKKGIDVESTEAWGGFEAKAGQLGTRKRWSSNKRCTVYTRCIYTDRGISAITEHSATRSMYQPLESNSLLSDFFPPRPLYLSPSISRTVQRFTRQCTRYEVLTPFAHTWQATIKDRFEMTQRYRFTLIRDTPVTINYSESVRIYPGLFFFFGKIYLFEIFNDLSSLNYPKFKFSLSRFSQFPNASLSHRDFKFFGFFSVEFLEKSFDLHVFETFNISLFFFFNIKLFENKFLPNSRISNIKLSSNFFFYH